MDVAIHRCLLNLLVNAMDALESDGDGWIRLKAWEDPSGYMVITVEDKGLGIESIIIERIFDPFFSTKSSRGTGLGLAMDDIEKLNKYVKKLQYLYVELWA